MDREPSDADMVQLEELIEAEKDQNLKTAEFQYSDNCVVIFHIQPPALYGTRDYSVIPILCVQPLP